VPASGSAAEASSERTHSVLSPFGFSATNAMRRPSGDSAIWPSWKANFSGGSNEDWILRGGSLLFTTKSVPTIPRTRAPVATSTVVRSARRLRPMATGARSPPGEPGSSRIAARSRATSLVDPYRSSGSFARQRSTTRMRWAGVRGATLASDSGSVSMMAESVCAAVRRSNARLPAIIS
jgi:hypothetical protein